MRRSQSKQIRFYVKPQVRDKCIKKAAEHLKDKHELQFVFYCAKPVNEIVNQARRPAFINYEQEVAFITIGEQMRRYYRMEETRVRMRNYSAYYAEILDYHSPNFPGLPQSQIFQKRKKRLFKLQKRLKHTDESVQRAIEPRRSVLKKLNRKTLYLDEIEAETSQALNKSHSQFQLEEYRTKEFRQGPGFQNAEVHDIFDPVFSSDEEGDKPLNRFQLLCSTWHQPEFPQGLNISISSRELVNSDLDHSECSNIKTCMKNSTDRILEDFSELIIPSDKRYELTSNAHSKMDATNPELSGVPPSNTQRKCPRLDGQTQRTVDTQNVTKIPNSSSNQRNAEAKNPMRNSKPFFVTMTHPQKPPPQLEKNFIGPFELKNRQGRLIQPPKQVKTPLQPQNAKKISETSLKKLVFETKKDNRIDPSRYGSITERKPEPKDDIKATGLGIRSSTPFSNYEMGRKRNSFTPVHPMYTDAPIRSIKFSLKDTGSTDPKRKPEVKSSFKKKDNFQTFNPLKASVTMKTKKPMIDPPTTTTLNKEMFASRVISTLMTNKSRIIPILFRKDSSNDQTYRTMKSNKSDRSLASQKDPKQAHTSERKMGKVGKRPFIDEYDYFADEQAASRDPKRFGQLPKFLKREPSGEKSGSQMSLSLSKHKKSEGSEKRNLLGQLREKIMGRGTLPPK